MRVCNFNTVPMKIQIFIYKWMFSEQVKKMSKRDQISIEGGSDSPFIKHGGCLSPPWLHLLVA